MSIAKISTTTNLKVWMDTINSLITEVDGKLGATENAVSATKLYTKRNISLGTGVTSTATAFDGTADIQIPINGIYGSYLTWGGKNITGDISPLDAACIDDFGHNKLAFLPGSCIKIERSTDGGATFEEVTSYSDSSKTSLVTSSCGIEVCTGVRADNGTLSKDTASKYKLRITISTRDSNKIERLYVALKTILIYYSTSGAKNNTVLIEKRTIANYNNSVDTWTTQGTYNVSGWSGWNSIPYTGGSFGGSSNQTGQIADLRFTFSFTDVDTNYSSVPSVIGFRFISTTSWAVPSTMANSGHLYTYDMSQNATFPAKVTASSFEGTSSSATKLATARTLQTNLASTTAASFDGTGNASIGVTGILPIANGGTGQSTANAAANAFINSLTTGEDIPADNDYCLFQYKNGGTTTTTFHRKKTSVIWNYVNSKISSVLGLTASSYGGNSASATKLATGRTISLTGDVTGSATFDGTTNVSITATVADDSHSHSNYLPLAGGTMTGTIVTPESTKPAFKFRNSTSYAATMNYDTNGNEALAINLQNALTSFMVNTGVDGTTWTSAGKWTSVTPALQVKNSSVSINELIPSGTTPAYTLNVNGDTNINGTIKFGDCIMEYDSSNKCVNFTFE